MFGKAAFFYGGIAPVMGLGLCLGLLGCTDDAPRLEPEVAHCAIIVGRATQVYGDITIIGVHTADVGDMRTVQLRFAYPPENTDFRVGTITCSYAFSLDLRADPKRVVKAASVYFRAFPTINESKLDLLNLC
jgi:hypothetical protein